MKITFILSCCFVLSAKFEVVVGVSGGGEVTAHSAPYQVAVVTSVWTDSPIDPEVTKNICAGSIIGPKVILTVASCLEGSDIITVIEGIHDFTQEESTRMTTTVMRTSIHPEYNSSTRKNDIALLFTQNPSPLNEVSNIIGLAPATIGSLAGEEALLTGWGETNGVRKYKQTLQGAVVQIISNEVCQKIIDDVEETDLCTSGENGVGACDIDVGSPLVKNDVQVGMVTRLPKRCGNGDPTVYIRIGKYVEWIKKEAGI
ncbi:hypothetical protein JTB14_014055 [Gonioctena quinquepunctata]|nr:hypothetical protein JTB14_014055 [Gonioctena quinquepunctata]